MTAERRTAQSAGRRLRVRSSGPAAAIAAVASAALVGAAVFGFSATGLHDPRAAVTGDVPGVPGSVQAIAAPTPVAPRSPFVRRPAATPVGVGVVVPAPVGGQTRPTPQPGGQISRPVAPPTSAPTTPASRPTTPPSRPTTGPGRPTTSTPSTTHPSHPGRPSSPSSHGKPPTTPGRPSKPPTPTPTPTKQPPSSIVVPFTKQQVELAGDAVVERVSTSLEMLAGPMPQHRAAVKKVSRQLDKSMDSAVTQAMNTAANSALDDAVKASQAKASDGQIRMVAAVSFRTALPSALQSAVAPLVSDAVKHVVPRNTDAAAVVLVASSAAAAASPEVAQQSTSTVVQAVASSVTDGGDATTQRAALAPTASATASATADPSSPPTPSAPSASPSSSDPKVAADAGPHAATVQLASTSSAGRRAPSKAPARVDDKVRPHSRVQPEKRRPAQAKARAKAPVKGRPAAAVKHDHRAATHRGAHLASSDDEPRRAPGRHRR
ncbi:MAG: hypothetical protein ACTHLJ_15455 [Angustibacter sp.]